MTEDTVNESVSATVKKADKNTARKKAVLNYLKSHEYIMNADVQLLFGVSIATANRILKKLTEDGTLQKNRIGSHWGYKLKKNK